MSTPELLELSGQAFKAVIVKMLQQATMSISKQMKRKFYWGNKKRLLKTLK